MNIKRQTAYLTALSRHPTELKVHSRKKAAQLGSL